MKPKYRLILSYAIVLALSTPVCADNAAQESASNSKITETPVAPKDALAKTNDTGKTDMPVIVHKVSDSSNTKPKEDDGQVTFRYNLPVGFTYKTVNKIKLCFHRDRKSVV